MIKDKIILKTLDKEGGIYNEGFYKYKRAY